MKSMRSLLMTPFCVVALGLVGCGGSGEFSDLQQYMDEVRARPKGHIKPLPKFAPYEGFTYSAAGLRSPFQRPVKVDANEKSQVVSTVRPDPRRLKEYLEGFSIESFAMVGTISNQKGLFGLVSAAGGVHPVKVGDYMGLNHGKIVVIDEGEIRLIEIVASGKDTWIERPRTISLKE